MCVCVHKSFRDFGPSAGVHLLLIQQSEMIFPHLLVVCFCDLAHAVLEWSSHIVAVVLHLLFHGQVEELRVHFQDFVHVLAWNTVIHNLMIPPTHHSSNPSSSPLPPPPPPLLYCKSCNSKLIRSSMQYACNWPNPNKGSCKSCSPRIHS